MRADGILQLFQSPWSTRVWARRPMGAWDDLRYLEGRSPLHPDHDCFETFTFPWRVGKTRPIIEAVGLAYYEVPRRAHGPQATKGLTKTAGPASTTVFTIPTTATRRS